MLSSYPAAGVTNFSGRLVGDGQMGVLHNGLRASNCGATRRGVGQGVRPAHPTRAARPDGAVLELRTSCTTTKYIVLVSRVR